ncbi:MAG: hypothetical protein VXZ82_09465 [Planctomycetota bacterium]|nr:hypothetical protein [Planctomycetota bacterium]
MSTSRSGWAFSSPMKWNDSPKATNHLGTKTATTDASTVEPQNIPLARPVFVGVVSEITFNALWETNRGSLLIRASLTSINGGKLNEKQWSWHCFAADRANSIARRLCRPSVRVCAS